MAPPAVREEYADLMKRNGDGHYLYTPQRYSLLHPGGMDDNELALDEPSDSIWKTVSSGSEAESSLGLKGGLSGLLSSAPVDIEANAKNTSGSTGKAALITTGVVKNQRFTGTAGPSIAGWSDQGLVVSYGGAGFRLHKIQVFRSKNPLEQTERAADEEVLFYQKIFDEDGNEIEGALYRPVYDENGKQIGEEKVDEEADRRKMEGGGRFANGEEDEEIYISCDAIGMSSNDLGIDTAALQRPAVPQLRVISTTESDTADEKEAKRKDFEEKMAEVQKIPDEDQRLAEMRKLYEANVTTVTTTYARENEQEGLPDIQSLSYLAMGSVFKILAGHKTPGQESLAKPSIYPPYGLMMGRLSSLPLTVRP
ncbi:hypothetical protein BJX70DRAFT_394562 [Aspergillus crustosus]